MFVIQSQGGGGDLLAGAKGELDLGEGEGRAVDFEVTRVGVFARAQ